ncbi:MAG: hypothetical protein KGI00_03740 [Candidatus Micrarchaeota archaeon]|nr:hypothetical protein [Candidatus Micrarchaeota archaeon]MDE1849813.1 hypothetical protein [Candidatus Micrarchaeota archaeon]
MDAKTYTKTITVFALAGTLFSGYLTAYTFLSGIPGCEVFYFGLPSCFYGFIVYLVIFIFSSLLFMATRRMKALAMLVLSLLGMSFATYLTLTVLGNTSCTTLDIFGQPPCVYGLAMFLLILIIAITALSPRK